MRSEDYARVVRQGFIDTPISGNIVERIHGLDMRDGDYHDGRQRQAGQRLTAMAATGRLSWRWIYTDAKRAYFKLRLPDDTTVVLDIRGVEHFLLGARAATARVEVVDNLQWTWQAAPRPTRPTTWSTP